MKTKITLSEKQMKRDEIPAFLKEVNGTLANWDECVNDKEFLKENNEELISRWIWVGNKNLKKIDTKELYVSDYAIQRAKKGSRAACLGHYGCYRRLVVYDGGRPVYAARVAYKTLSKRVLSETKTSAKPELDDIINDLQSRVEELEKWRTRVSE